MKIDWENVIYSIGESTRRLKVYGGWLVLYESVMSGNEFFPATMCFIPDFNHEWTIEENNDWETNNVLQTQRR